MTFYRNGVLQGTTTNTHTSVSQAALPLWIGRGVSGNYFEGSLDDIGIWNRAITPNEVAILYQSALGLNDFSASKTYVFLTNVPTLGGVPGYVIVHLYPPVVLDVSHITK